MERKENGRGKKEEKNGHSSRITIITESEQNVTNVDPLPNSGCC